MEKRTLFRKCPRGVLFFSTWRQSTAKTDSGRQPGLAQSGKVRGFMEQWKDQLKLQLVIEKPELISKEQNYPCKTSTDQRVKFRWNETEK